MAGVPVGKADGFWYNRGEGPTRAHALRATIRQGVGVGHKTFPFPLPEP
jgi:hypothetical protein